jgi:hypothetical protein
MAGASAPTKCRCRRRRTVVPNCLNPPKISDLTNFSSKSYQTLIISVSAHFIHFISKIYQTVANISMINKFQDFLNQILGGFKQFGPHVRRRRRHRHRRSSSNKQKQHHHTQYRQPVGWLLFS